MALILPALARLRASSSRQSCMKLSLTGAQVDWTTKTSSPRTLLPISMRTSPSLNLSHQHWCQLAAQMFTDRLWPAARWTSRTEFSDRPYIRFAPMCVFPGNCPQGAGYLGQGAKAPDWRIRRPLWLPTSKEQRQAAAVGLSVRQGSLTARCKKAALMRGPCAQTRERVPVSQEPPCRSTPCPSPSLQAGPGPFACRSPGFTALFAAVEDTQNRHATTGNGASRIHCESRENWLGRKDSNPRMTGPKTRCLTCLATPQHGFFRGEGHQTLGPARASLCPVHCRARSWQAVAAEGGKSPKSAEPLPLMAAPAAPCFKRAALSLSNSG